MLEQQNLKVKKQQKNLIQVLQTIIIFNVQSDVTIKLTKTMAYILEQRFKNMDQRIETLYNIKLRFFRQSSDGCHTELNSNRRSNKVNTGCCSPTLIQGTLHHSLSKEQLRFLNRGPAYVMPCQMHISSHIPIDEILTQQITPLQEQLTKLFTKYPVNGAYKWHFENQIKEQFMKSFSEPIPTAIEKRAVYEKQLITSIHNQLKRRSVDFTTYSE